jgi:hypothetical protein
VNGRKVARAAIEELTAAGVFNRTHIALAADVPTAVEDSRAAAAQHRSVSLTDSATKNGE